MDGTTVLAVDSPIDQRAGDLLISPALSGAALEEVLTGRSTMLQIPGTRQDQHRANIDFLDSPEMGRYDEELVFPRIGKMGPAVNEYEPSLPLPPEYWSIAEASDRHWHSQHRDIRAETISRIEAAWGSRVEPAEVGGGNLYAGIVREINDGTHVHFDDIIHERPRNFLRIEPVAQVAVNLFLSLSESGGQTDVWRRRWHKGDERLRKGYGFSEEVVAGIEPAVATPRLGDLLIIGSRWYHRVRPTSGGGRRITLSFCLGLTRRGELIVWS